MHVSLNTTALSSQNSTGTSRPLASGRPEKIAQTKTPTSDYPASPLLSTRPQRYSVQLNDQLTTQQQADRYLATLEKALLDYRHDNRGNGAASGQQIERLLAGRTTLFGNAVDGQLKPVLQGSAQVIFHCPGLAQAVSQTQPEALLFSVRDGRHTRMSAVCISDTQEPRQARAAMTNALRRIGININDSTATISFSCSEKQWPAIAQSLSITGEGVQFPQYDAQALNPVREAALCDKLQSALQSGGKQGQATINQVLGRINDEREKLALQQEKAHKLIDNMSRLDDSQNAIQISSTLANHLHTASHNYQLLAEAVNGHGRFSSRMVHNLLHQE